MLLFSYFHTVINDIYENWIQKIFYGNITTYYSSVRKEIIPRFFLSDRIPCQSLSFEQNITANSKIQLEILTCLSKNLLMKCFRKSYPTPEIPWDLEIVIFLELIWLTALVTKTHSWNMVGPYNSNIGSLQNQKKLKILLKRFTNKVCLLDL